jgi:DNA-binding helix-hairpin-helix protein with protein kinase domain
MPVYKGLSGKTYTLEDNPFAGGGEGKIFSVRGDQGIVAKIYHDHLRTDARGKKLALMMKAPPEAEYIKYFTWPQDVLYENNKFVGYVMQRLHGNKRLNEMYSYDKRQGLTWKFCLAITKNLASLVNNVHKRGHVIGDLNPNNIIVDPQNALVTLVDTDSYHIRDTASGQTYRCEVGMAEFLPPNLQGINFKTAPLPTFSVESDLFALAVLIFSMLMNGAHPFACAVKGVSGESFQPVDNIKKGFYPYADSQTGVSIPKYAPDITALPAKMQNMFRTAFLTRTGIKRPTANEWYNALKELHTQLRTCSKDASHMFYQNRSACPWCQVNAQMAALGGGNVRPKPRPQPAPAPAPRPTPSRQRTRKRFRLPPISLPSIYLPDISIAGFLAGLVALIYGGGIGYGVFSLLDRFFFHNFFVFCIIVGSVAGIAAFLIVLGSAEEFLDEESIFAFLYFLVKGLFLAVTGVISGAVTLFFVWLGISLVFSIICGF